MLNRCSIMRCFNGLGKEAAVPVILREYCAAFLHDYSMACAHRLFLIATIQKCRIHRVNYTIVSPGFVKAMRGFSWNKFRKRAVFNEKVKSISTLGKCIGTAL